MSFSGRVALITGSTRGIGHATAAVLAARGAHVLISGRDDERGRQVVEQIRSDGGRAEFLPADLLSTIDCAGLAARALDTAGRVDILVNNAAIGSFGLTTAVTEHDFDECYAINVRAPFTLVRSLAPAMAERGDGVIVNVTTMVASFGTAGSVLYASSKAALTHLTKCWAAEFGPKGVRVNAVAPGPTATENAVSTFGEDGLAAMMRATPARRVAEPGEIAETIAFVASARAGFIHGAVVPVDGGRTAV